MLRPLFGLAAACAAIGLLPVLVLPPALRVGALVAAGVGSAAAVGAPGTAASLSQPYSDPTAGTLTIFAVALAAALLAAWGVRARRAPRRDGARAETWGCGYASPTARMQYTASSFASPILTAFRTVAGLHVQRTPEALATHALDPVLDGVVLPAWRGVRTVADRLRPIQRGRLAHYLLYLAAAVITLLLYLLLAGRTT
jgi:hypothetical protein